MNSWRITVRTVRLFSLLLPITVHAQGQQGSGSPYSAYGLGEFVGCTQLSQAMMGGLSAAVVDPVSTVLDNPASYPFLQRTVFETGLQVRTSTYTTSSTERLGRGTEVLGLTLGVPFGAGRWGLGLGVRPVSQVNYRISDTAPVPGVEGDATLTYSGDGGLDQALLGVGWMALHRRDSLNNGHRLSIGVNLGYLFGRIEGSSRAAFPVGQGLYGTLITSSLIVRDPTANVGVQWQGDLRKRRQVSDDGLRYLIGVSAELPVALTARRTDVAYTYGFTNSGAEVPIDTSYFVDGRLGELGTPLGWAVGATVYDRRWTVGVELRQRDWSALRVNVEGYTPPGELTARTTAMLGAAFRPADEVGGGFWERTIYRVGARVTEDYLVVEGTRLAQRSASAGVSLPIMGTSTRSRLNLGCEVGERGTLENGLLRERFTSFFVGITITPDIREQWFKKRRIE